MIKAVIFDLDGVLCETKDLHYQALNRALESVNPAFVISEEDHVRTYCGLSTKQKLHRMTNIPVAMHPTIEERKRQFTNAMLTGFLTPSPTITSVFVTLKNRGLRVAVASNAVRETVETILRDLNLLSEIEFFLGNQDVAHPKPAPDIYIKAFRRLGLPPDQCLVVEDSPHGREAASASGAHVFFVDTPHQVPDILNLSLLSTTPTRL